MVDLKLSPDAALREAIELFYFGYRAFTAGPDRTLAEQGLGRVHHRVLYFVGRDPGVSVTGLLAILGVSKQALNAPLRELVARGLVAVRADATDRRYRRLSLTPAGRALERQLTATQQALLQKVFEHAGPRQTTGWKNVLRGLADERASDPGTAPARRRR